MSTKTTPEIVDFDAAGLLGGIIHEDLKPGGDMSQDPEEVAKKLLGASAISNVGFLGDEYERKTVKSLCFPLYSILLALENPTVHYLR